MITLYQLNKITELRSTALQLVYLTEDYFDLQLEERKKYILDTLTKFTKEFNTCSKTHYLTFTQNCGDFIITLHRTNKPSELLTNKIKFNRTNVNLHICDFVSIRIEEFVKRTISNIIE